jgi:hypothetical protein
MSVDFDTVFDADADFAPDDPLAPVHSLIVRARDAYGRLPAPTPRADLAVLFRDQPERAALIALAPLPSTTRARVRRVRRVLLVAAALAVALVTTGGLAVAGSLPAGMQKTIADVLDRVGVDVPRGPGSTPPATPPSTAVDTTPGSPAGASTGTATSTPTPPPAPTSTPMTSDPVAAADPSAPAAPVTTLPGLPEAPVAPVVPLPPAIDQPRPTPPALPAVPVVPIDPPVDVPAIISSVDAPPLPADAHGPARPDLPAAAVANRKVKP